MIKHFKILLPLFFVIVANPIFSQDSIIREYSYTQFFKLIEEETDSIFYLKNAIIKPTEDEKERFNFPMDFTEIKKEVYDSIHVRKQLKLENVNFKIADSKNSQRFGLSYMVFHDDVELINTRLSIITSNFKENLKVYTNGHENGLFKNDDLNNWVSITYSKLEKGIIYDAEDSNNNWYFALLESEIWNNSDSYWHSVFSYENQKDFSLFKNKFLGSGKLALFAREGANIDIQKNIFELDYSMFELGRHASIKQINFNKNTFSGIVQLAINEISNQHIIGWPQFENKLISHEAYNFYTYFIIKELDKSNAINYSEEYYKFSSKSFEHYLDVARIENDETFRTEMKLRGRLYKLYKDQYATDFANAAYIEMKDLETQRLEFLYHQTSTFKTYFTWKTNQFLKVFSAYGTEPARAIIFSLYVIIFFALIYLFFPNSWDKHGKNRIVDRYNFFFKYMKRKAGIHEVYLDDQKEELMSYDQFKSNISNSEQKVPKFFTVTALPLYKWSVSGTKLSASLLKRVDIMKGTWQELPAHKRFWKSMLLVSAFLIAILYDIFIKMLNALMLSINTFTTLGFGEIPIKGLPRYLAIIQGFIGWFMLTIFSVSLISQLLN